MIGFWAYMLTMTLLLPTVMLVFGICFAKKAPRNINLWFGYRTERSMKNRDTWEFAHHACGQLWKTIGAVGIPVTAIAMLPAFGKSVSFVGIYGLVIVGIQLAAVIGSVFAVESALKKTFDEQGNRK